jgi:hypothetical protein
MIFLFKSKFDELCISITIEHPSRFVTLGGPHEMFNCARIN